MVSLIVAILFSRTDKKWMFVRLVKSYVVEERIQLEPTTLWGANVTPTPIIASVVRLNTAVRKTAPNSHEERRDDDRAYQGDTPRSGSPVI
jgi:hypothetical protein